jgi:hypothetical protein
MWLLPKKLFRWKEPKECRGALLAVAVANTKWWLKPTVALLSMGLLLSQWLLATFDPNKHPPPLWAVVPLAFAAGLVFSYGFPWLLSLCPAYIMVFEDRLCRVVANTNQTWKWADIKSYDWRDCGEYDLLVLEHRKGNQLLIGVPREVSREELQRFLTSRKLEEFNAGRIDVASVFPAGKRII